MELLWLFVYLVGFLGGLGLAEHRARARSLRRALRATPPTPPTAAPSVPYRTPDVPVPVRTETPPRKQKPPAPSDTTGMAHALAAMATATEIARANLTRLKEATEADARAVLAATIDTDSARRARVDNTLRAIECTMSMLDVAMRSQQAMKAASG